ncbi:MAG: hypothetical protein VX899_17680 [Myxococcota bacterium]|nr:hypothetical protein [Myxococcota bacterium]
MNLAETSSLLLGTALLIWAYRSYQRSRALLDGADRLRVVIEHVEVVEQIDEFQVQRPHYRDPISGERIRGHENPGGDYRVGQACQLLRDRASGALLELNWWELWAFPGFLGWAGAAWLGTGIWLLANH